MKFYKKAVLILISAVLFLVPSCSKNKDNDAVPHADVISTKLTIGMYSPDSYNPLDTTTVYNEQAYFLIFDSLFNINEKFEAEKNLASDITMENSGNSVIIQLKPNVKFHNGETLTSYDVKATIDYILNNGGFYSYNVRNISDVEIINTYTLKLNLKYHTPNIALQLTFPIISRENAESLNGTGPYKVLDNTNGKQINLIKSDDYHNKFETQVKKVEINLIPDKITAKSLSNSGILDIFFSPYSDEGLKTITKSQSFKRDYLTDSYVFLKLNFNNPLIFLKSFRKALNVGIDRKKIVEDVYMTHAEPTALPVPQSSVIYNPLCTSEQKSDEAISLISECGYEDSDSDGIAEYTNYNPENTDETGLPRIPEIDFLISDEPSYVSVAESVANDLKKLGIVVKIQKCNREAYEERYVSDDYDICLVSTSCGYDIDTTAFLGNGGVFASPLEYGYESSLSKLSATPLNDLQMPTYTTLFSDFYENPAHIPLVYLKNTLITNDKFKEFDDIYLNNIYYKILLGKENKSDE